MTDPGRQALVVANDRYDDDRLQRLRAPATDAQELSRVLGDPQIGGFDVEVSLNEPEHVVRRRLSAFFDDRRADDVLLLHLSCHGVKDEDGRLYFATPDTVMEHLDATSIPAEFVNRQMTRSRSRRILLLLDCCYSGAFARGMLSRGDNRMDIKERFDGRGRIVLTASSAMEYSFEGDRLSGAGQPSVFTSAVVEGLATGAADRNGDGYVSVDELYEFAYDRVRSVTPSQTPGKWVFDVQGDFYVARNRVAAAVRALLPPELEVAIASPLSHVRSGAVEELAVLLAGPDEEVRSRAKAALEELAEDDSKRVADAAARQLGDQSAGHDAPAVPVVAVDLPGGAGSARRAGPMTSASAAESPSVTARRPTPTPTHDWRVLPLAVGAALAILVAAPVPLLATNLDRWNAFAVLSPVEVLGIVVWLGWLTRAIATRRISNLASTAVLAATGLLTAAGSVGLVKFSHQRIDGPATGLAAVALCGAVAAGGAGLLSRRGAADETSQRPDPSALVLTLSGAGLLVVSLLVPYDGFSSLWSEVGEGSSAEFFFEPAASLVLLAVSLAGLTSRPRTSGILLIVVGGQTALHFVGVVAAAARAIGEVGDVRAGGFLGILAGLLAVLGGSAVIRSGQAISDLTPSQQSS